MKLNLMLQTWDLLVFVARFQKENILWRTSAKSVEEIKVTKLKYLITIGLQFLTHCNKKTSDRSLSLCLLYYQKQVCLFSQNNNLLGIN